MFLPFPFAFSSSKQKLKHNFCQLILLFSLFLLLFTGLIAHFDIIYGSHCTISANFYWLVFISYVQLFKTSRFSSSYHFFQGRSILKLYLRQLILASIFYQLAYFCYYSWVLLHFLILFMNSIVLFQLTCSFIYSTLIKKFSISTK